MFVFTFLQDYYQRFVWSNNMGRVVSIIKCLRSKASRLLILDKPGPCLVGWAFSNIGYCKQFMDSVPN